MFTQDHDEYLPKAWFNDEPNTGDPGGWSYRDPLWGWDYVLQPYLKNKQVFKCPSDPRQGNQGFRGLWTTASTPYSGGTLGAKHTEDDIPNSYRYNLSNHPNGPWNALPLAAMDRPAEAIIIAESVAGVDEADWHQVATWEGGGDGDRARVCKDYTNNIAFDRHINKTGRSVQSARSHTSETAQKVFTKSQRDSGHVELRVRRRPCQGNELGINLGSESARTWTTMGLR
jgi:hypothetical protein